MLASLIVVFREVLEAGLIVGIVLAATQSVPGRARWIIGGIASGVFGAVLLASFAGALSDAIEGSGQEVFNASILLVAVVMLAWHVLWMARHGREMTQQMRAMGQAVVLGQKSLLALAVVVALAVLREGAEVVLFLYGIAASSNAGAAPLVTGGALGIVAGGLISWLLYRGLLTIPVRHLFSVTGAMIALLAAGMAGQAAAILAGADLIPTWGLRCLEQFRAAARKQLAWPDAARADRLFRASCRRPGRGLCCGPRSSAHGKSVHQAPGQGRARPWRRGPGRAKLVLLVSRTCAHRLVCRPLDRRCET